MVEVVCATMICTIGLSGLMFSYRTSFEAVHRSRDYGTALTLMENLYSELRAGVHNPGTESEGDFGDSDYRWKIEYTITDKANLYLAELEIYWEDRGKTRRIKNQTFYLWESNESLL